jgi:hypothetical protein
MRNIVVVCTAVLGLMFGLSFSGASGQEGQSTKMAVKDGIATVAGQAIPVYPGIKEIEWAKNGDSIVVNYAVPMKSFNEKNRVFVALQKFYRGKTVFGVQVGVIKKLNRTAPPGEEGASEAWDFNACVKGKPNISIILIADQRQECVVYVTLSNNCE